MPVDGSKARHKSTQQYYRDIQKLSDDLKAEVVDLQQQKETAREELRRAKKEIQTEKLKGAATVAAANIAIELEEEARQRERQQAKQMQEMKSTYEQQNGKLSEFVNFVKCYFPYVEKLIPTINFLRDRLGFDDGIIRRLCTFKDVAIKGKLYSSEFNQSFETKRSICAIKENENGKFDFNIDGVPHVSWFRKKMSEFREAIGIPKPRQNRGIKL